MTSVFSQRNTPPPWIATAGIVIAGCVVVFTVFQALTSDTSTIAGTPEPGAANDPAAILVSGDPATSTTNNPDPVDPDLITRAAETVVASLVGQDITGPVGPRFVAPLPIAGADTAEALTARTVRNDSGIAGIEVTATVTDRTGGTTGHTRIAVFAEDTDGTWVLGLITDQDN